MLKVSVALCTYNGESYIADQLYSISSQTRSVDEIVICDDKSTDNTISIIESFKRQNKVTVELFANERNIGCRANFRKAINLCSGDVIFLSDQDDVWIPEKVERVLKWFDDNPNKDVVFSNGSFIDKFGHSYAEGFSLFSSYGMTKRAMRWMKRGFALELFLKNNKATGATMAFKKKIIDDCILDCSSIGETPYHDAQICLYAIQRNSLGFIPDNLIYYRIHENQDCGVKSICNPMKTDNILSPLNDYLILGKYLTDSQFISRYHFLENRRLWVTAGDFFSVLKKFKEYFHFYSGLGVLCYLWDVALCIKFSFKN